MTLTRDEQLLLQAGEESRQRAMSCLDQAGDAILCAQDLHDAGESFIEAAKLMALRARRERKAQVVR